VCEHFVARSEEPFRIDELWGFTEKLERFGIAGFGWGAAWLTAEGRLETHRDVRAFRDDPERERVGAIETRSLLVHLRRPSRLSTLGEPDTQPFPDPAGRFVFSHNGDLAEHKPWRDRYRAEGRIEGKADSEVGQRWLEDNWSSSRPADTLLCSLHEVFGGSANFALLEANGALHSYAGNRENLVFTFRLGAMQLASTGIYSLDRSLFRFVVPSATERRLVPLKSTVRFA
jgi:predicted glutamine amidotransferase